MRPLRIPNRSVLPEDFPGSWGICQNLHCRAAIEPPYQLAQLSFAGRTLTTLLCGDCLPEVQAGVCPPLQIEVVPASPVPIPPDQAGASSCSSPLVLPHEFQVLTCADLLNRRSAGPARWGRWVYDAEELALVHTMPEYQIDFARVRSSAALLDWIFHLLHKGWATARTMHHLLRAFDDVLQPRQHYCPFEVDRQADGADLARKFARQPTVSKSYPQPIAHEPNDWLPHSKAIQVMVAAGVGFPVEVYCAWSGVTGVGDGDSYQIMPCSDAEGGAFWQWHLCENEQFYATPLLAGQAFVLAYLHFQRRAQP